MVRLAVTKIHTASLVRTYNSPFQNVSWETLAAGHKAKLLSPNQIKTPLCNLPAKTLQHSSKIRPQAFYLSIDRTSANVLVSLNNRSDLAKVVELVTRIQFHIQFA